MQNYFNALADHLSASLQGDEVYTSTFNGEDSEFVRFNAGDVRQAGSVTQRYQNVDLINGRRHASGSVSLSGDLEDDKARLSGLLSTLREMLPFLPEDPYLLYSTDVQSGERRGSNALADPDDALTAIRGAGEGRDLVGLYAAGQVGRGFANSFGQRNWYDTWNYNLDWSFYHSADKAVKASYAGFEWEPAAFERKVQVASQQLDALAREAVTVKPGPYRVYLAPAAVSDMVGILGWGGFGLKAHRTRQTPLLKMLTGDAAMAEDVTMLENTVEGVAPNFQAQGYLRPDRVTLIEGGQLKDCLVSPRSAKEFDVPTNGATGAEAPLSLDVAGGAVPVDGVLSRLDRGIYIGNVHYLNYSDRSACRTTGMTRFATFWVEGGEIQAPLNVMRFDETLFRVLGENLVGLTAEREMVLDPGTYDGRNTKSMRVPGALVEDFAFTL